MTMMRALAVAILLSFVCVAGVAMDLGAPGAPRDPGQVLGLSEYRVRLEGIRAALGAGRLDEARAVATSLLGTEIRDGDWRFFADASVLVPIAALQTSDAQAPRDPQVPKKHRARPKVPQEHQASPKFRQELPARRCFAALGVLLQALAEADPAAVGGVADRERLEALRQGQARQELERGGEVAVVPVVSSSAWQQVLDVVKRAYDWILEVAERIWDWLESFWPRRLWPAEGESFLGTPWMITAMVAAIAALLAVLAARALLQRRFAAATVSESSESGLSSGRDEDPLSRQASEWESYAAELAAAGRWREAIRAWYHAVLVALYRSGVLHYRKGRTNWEYVAALPPQVAYRPGFLAMTRRFEQEWYGHAVSSAEALDEFGREARALLARVIRKDGRPVPSGGGDGRPVPPQP